MGSKALRVRAERKLPSPALRDASLIRRGLKGPTFFPNSHATGTADSRTAALSPQSDGARTSRRGPQNVSRRAFTAPEMRSRARTSAEVSFNPAASACSSA